MKSYTNITIDGAFELLMAHGAIPECVFSSTPNGPVSKPMTLTGLAVDPAGIMRFTAAESDAYWRICKIPYKPLITEEQRRAILTFYPDAKWLTMEKFGHAFVAFSDKPILHNDSWEGHASAEEDLELPEAFNGYTDDFKQSLVDLRIEIT